MKLFPKELTDLTRALWYTEEQTCVFCGSERGVVCDTCVKEYLCPELGRCKDCGKLISPEKECCLDCQAGRGPKHLDKVAAWGYYSGAFKEFIHTFKFKAQPRLIGKIAQPLADWAISQLPSVEGIVAVPMHPLRLAERGFNQAEALASALHWELGIPIVRGVERIKPTLSQTQLNRKDRLHNLKGAFSVRQSAGFLGKSVWLVDDVTTTGATLEAVAEVLRENGVEEVYGLCLAAGLEKKLVPF